MPPRATNEALRMACDTKGRGFESRPFHFQVTTLGKLFTHTHASVTKQLLVPVKGPTATCGWEGNRRSGVALAMHHGLQ